SPYEAEELYHPCAQTEGEPAAVQENVEKTLSCMDHVISYYHVASDTEKIISEGPTDLTSSADDLEVQEEAPLEHLPESMLQDMVRVSRWLVEYGRNQDFVNIYYQIRSSQLDRSIKGLKEPFWKSISSSVVAYSSARGDTPTKRKDTPTKKPVKQPVLTVFPTLQHLKQTNPKFDHVLQGTATSSKNKYPSLITSMGTFGAKALGGLPRQHQE
ncbi:Exocyst complex component 7, partial [Camelus dromedarius]